MSMITTNAKKYARKFVENAAVRFYIDKTRRIDRLMSVIAEAGCQPGYRPDTAADFFRRMDITCKDPAYRILFLDTISDSDLQHLMQNPPLDMGFFEHTRFTPTPHLLRLAEDCRYNGAFQKKLEGLIELFKKGKFEADNPLHIETEYLRFGAGRPYSDFLELPWMSPEDIFLDRNLYDACKSTAIEAIDVYKAILERKVDGIPTLIIGNMRYGGNFVVKPLESMLEDNDFIIAYEYISSKDFDTKEFGYCHISAKTTRMIKEMKPNVFIVDGTAGCFDEGMTRFPSAMWGFIDYFKQMTDVKDTYGIEFWAPDMTSNVKIGDRFAYHGEGKNPDAPRKAVLISSVRHKFGSIAFFDNIEEHIYKGAQKNVPKMVECFTANGYSQVPKAPNETVYVQKIQEMIKEEIHMIMTSSYTNR